MLVPLKLGGYCCFYVRELCILFTGTEEASSFKCKEDGEHDFEKSPGIEVSS